MKLLIKMIDLRNNFFREEVSFCWTNFNGINWVRGMGSD